MLFIPVSNFKMAVIFNFVILITIAFLTLKFDHFPIRTPRPLFCVCNVLVLRRNVIYIFFQANSAI